MKDELDEIVLEIMRWQRDDNGLPRFEHYREKGKQAINAYILGEVMELIGEDENKKVVDWDCPCGTQHHLESDYYQRNQLRQELRNKANERWGK